jgi:hypothetical protein
MCSIQIDTRACEVWYNTYKECCIALISLIICRRQKREMAYNFNERIIPPRKQPKQNRTKKFTSVGFSMM